MITDVDETAIAALPEGARTDSLQQDGIATGQAQTAELTGLINHVGGSRSSRLDLTPRGTDGIGQQSPTERIQHG